MHQWFAVQTTATHEQYVYEHLTYKGYQAFLPVKQQQEASKLPVREVSLFPGYLFCQLCNGLPKVITTPHVVRIVGYGRRPVPIDVSEIEMIKLLISCPRHVEPCRFIAGGDRVRIADGVLAGLTGTVLHVKNAYRIVVSVPLLQRSVAVEVDRDLLIPCH
jgi:transcription antitermination factor NusG